MTLNGDVKFKRNWLMKETWYKKFNEFWCEQLNVCTLVSSFCPIFSKAYKVSSKNVQKNYASWHWRVMQALQQKMTFGLKNGMINLVNFQSSIGKSENLYADGLLSSRECNISATWVMCHDTEERCKNRGKNNLWLQK